MKKVFLVIVSAIVSVSAMAQDKLEANVSADLVSSYIWRGEDLDDAAIQPTLGLSYKGLSFTAWGSYGITGKADITKELDLTLGYTISNFNVGITDYWTPTADESRYFLYDAHRTAHFFEANVGYDFGFLNLQWFTGFAGSDYNKPNGDRSYSSYVELSAPFKLGGLDWEANLGAVPFNASESCYAPYSNSEGFAVTNISVKATKDIKITDTFSIPVFGQLATNPSTQKAYFVFGFTLQP